MALSNIGTRPLVPGMYGFSVTSHDGVPTMEEYEVASASAQIIPGDPVVLLTSGKIRRATPSDASLLGFAAGASGFTGFISGPFSHEPIYTTNRMMANDSLAGKRIMVYVADNENQFTARTKGTSSLAIKGATYDLSYLLAAPTPTVTPGGTTGATTWTYKIIPLSMVGQANAGTAGTTTSGNATLSATNYNDVTWSAVTNAVEYQIWKLISGTYYYIGTVQAGQTLTFRDTGYGTADHLGGSIPSVEGSGYVLDLTASSNDVFKITEILVRNPNESVATTGQEVRFIIPAAKSHYVGADPLSS